MKLNKEIIQDGLLFDGAFGTYFTSLHPDVSYSCEYANIKEPEYVIDIHRQYLQAGAKAIKTNTFCSDQESLQCDDMTLQSILTEGYRLAKKAADEYDAYVFADIGPIVERKECQPFVEYKRIVDAFLQVGATNFLFETLHNDIALHEIIAYIKQTCPQALVILSFAISADGYTRQGFSGAKLFYKAQANEHIDVIGFNCVCGSHHLFEYLKTLDCKDSLLAIMPNAGYPTILNNRTFFADTSTYFADEMKRMREYGVHIIGGCCGTTPQYIEKIAQRWKVETFNAINETTKTQEMNIHHSDNLVAKKLYHGKKIIAVELDPPANCDIQKFMENAHNLQESGVDCITIADCPIARARVDSSLLAAKVKRELNLDVIPHMTCRDRNINATKALLFGLQIEGIRNVLVVTGDPIPQAERNEVKAVFNFNSQILANYLKDLNETIFPSPFTIYGALNINAPNFKAELAKAQRKVTCGVEVFMSQPVLSKQALDNLILAKQHLQAKILGGIIPIVSHRNALFMNNEVTGIHVDEEIIQLYENKSREESEIIALKVAKAVVKEIAPYVDGFYLITPFQRVALIEDIIRYIQTM